MDDEQRPLDRIPETAQERAEICRDVFDSLAINVAVLDPDGTIVAVNRNWTEFALAYGGDMARCGVGVNYLEVCASAKGDQSDWAVEAAAGIETVLAGGEELFELDYPCPPIPGQERWFQLAALPLRGERPGAVVSHTEVVSRGPQLSRREREIMLMLARGHSGEQTAKELFISPATVQTHVRNAVQKLGANNRTHALAIALREGQIRLQDRLEDTADSLLGREIQGPA